MKLRITTQFKKDIKKLKSQRKGKKAQSILEQEIIPKIIKQEILPSKFKDHPLLGDWIPARECHIFPDTLLIYRHEQSMLILIRIGSHSDLFG